MKFTIKHTNSRISLLTVFRTTAIKKNGFMPSKLLDLTETEAMLGGINFVFVFVSFEHITFMYIHKF